jgi:hypothetical protein
MTKRPKLSKPQKAPIIPPDPDATLTDIGMSDERLIGRVVVAWSKMENTMEEFIWELLSLDVSLGRILTSRLDVTIKIRHLRELGQAQMQEAMFLDLSSILDRIDFMRDDRNMIVHGTWARNKDWIPIVLSLRQKSLSPDEVVGEAFPNSRMLILARNVAAARFQLMRLMKQYRAWHDKSAEPHPSD